MQTIWTLQTGRKNQWLHLEIKVRRKRERERERERDGKIKWREREIGGWGKKCSERECV